MGLLDIFRPKWKHSRGEVRLEAVRELGEDETGTLTEVARRDPDAKIREVALRKLSDPKLLDELAREERDEALRELVQKRLSELSLRQALDAVDDGVAVSAVERINAPKMLVDVIRRGASSAARHRALLRLDDPRSLAEVAQKADDPQMRAEAVAKIGDPKALRDLALGEATKAVQLLAVERLAEPASLRTVADRARNKAVRGAARARLAALGVPDDAKKEAKAKKTSDPAAEARLKQRKIEVEMRRRSEEERKRSVDDKKTRLEAEHMERLRRLESEEVAQKEVAEPRKQEKRAGDALVDGPVPVSERPRRELSPEEQAKKAAREAERTAREAEKAQKQNERAVQAKENAEQLESIVTRLEALAASSDVDMKESGAALKEAQASQAVRGPLPENVSELRARYDQARAKLSARLGELREAEDWRRFANLPKIEALVVRSESLAKVVIGAIKLDEGQELDARKVSRELRAMQQEWKSHGRPPKEKADSLWERFKAACDIIYEGNKQGLDALDEDRQANLKMKEELCAKVEALVDSAEAQANGKATGEQIKQLQEDWKKIGPVPKADNDAIWKRFRGACDRFFETRKATFEKNDGVRGEVLEKQLALVARAESLAASTDFRVTAEKLKDLQDQWKQLGAGKRGESDEAWQKFRAACDRFFERRKAHFAEQDDERASNLVKKEALVAEATRLAETDIIDVDAKIKELMAEWKKVGPVAKAEGDAIWARFGQALDALRAPPAPPPEVLAEASGGKFENHALAEKLKGPEPKVEAKPEPKIEAKPEPKIEAKPEPKVEAKPEPKVEAKPEPEPKVEAKPKPEPKVEAKPEPKVEAKPEPVVVASVAPVVVEPEPKKPDVAQDAWPAPEAWTLPDDET